MTLGNWFYCGVLHTHQLYTVRIGSIAVSLKGKRNQALFSERYRMNCSAAHLPFGYRLVFRWKC